jgi:hypothetical protein
MPPGDEDATLPSCEPGAALDASRRACLAPGATRARAARDRVLPDEAVLGCAPEDVLLVTSDRVACFPRASVAPPAPKACAALEIAAGGRCVPIARRAGGVVDVATWSRAVLGADGGPGSPRLCAALARAPGDFDVPLGGARDVSLAVRLVFPDNDVTQVVPRVDVRDAAGGPVNDRGARLAGTTIDGLLAPLRALAGTAESASETLRVTCKVSGGTAARVLPGPKGVTDVQ